MRASRGPTNLLALVLLAAHGAANGQPAVTPDFRRDMLLVGPTPAIAAADRAWGRRDQGRVGGRARPKPISEAVSGYEKAAEAREDAEARWKLARALFFKAKYTGLDRDSQLALLEKARKVGDEAVAIMRRRAAATGALSSGERSTSRVASALVKDRDAAASYFWAAVGWGEWALLAGRLRAARAGAATKIRDYAQTVIAIDSHFEEGGGFRILGRLHDRAPRIRGLTGWVSRAEAIRNLRNAVREAPRNFVNRHFLAEALFTGGAAERAEAIRIERSLTSDAPSPGHLVEDAAIQEEAKRNLRTWGQR